MVDAANVLDICDYRLKLVGFRMIGKKEMENYFAKMYGLSGYNYCPSSQKCENRRAAKQNVSFRFDEGKSRSNEDSDEDAMELLRAVEMHLKNKPDRPKPIIKTTPKSDSADTSVYENQGAIPKRLRPKNVKNLTNKKSKNKPQLVNIVGSRNETELPPTDKTVAENSNGFPSDQRDRNTVGKGGVSRLHVRNPSQPFIYIVPENPSPHFTLPPGNYYVATDNAGLPTVSCIISHPKDSIAVEHEKLGEHKNSTSRFQNELSKTRLAEPAVPFKNNLVCREDGEERKNSREEGGSLTLLEKFEDIESALLAGNFDKVGVPVHILQLRLKEKINALNVAVENLSLLQTIEKIEPDLFSKTVLYDKQFGTSASDSRKEEINQDKIFVLGLLFPHSDRQDLRKEVEECDEGEHSFLDLIKRKTGAVSEEDIHPAFNLLLAQLPDHDLEILYKKWLECLGDEEKLRKFVDEEKKILELQQIIQTELPEISVLEARKRAENFLHDESAFDRFLTEQCHLKKINEQFLRMSLALPEIDPAELLSKCQELQGDEDLVNEYILKLLDQMKKETHFLTMQSVVPDAEPEFLRRAIEELKDDNEINILTNSLLENKNYPKIEMDSGAIERQKLWTNYVDNFDVRDFLLETDAEEELVLNENNKQLVLEFFKTRYPTISDDPLQQEELLRNFKMSDMLGMCERLDGEIEFINLNCSNFKNSKFTKSFLQKVCKIDKREEINRYLQEAEDLKKAQAVVAREQNAFLQCPLCYEDEVVESDAGTCSEGHVFCKTCIKKYVMLRTSDGIYEFECLTENCNGFFSDRILSELLPKSIFEKITFKVGAEEVGKANVEGLEFCTACDFAYIPLPEEKIFYCQNPDCLKQICRNCKEDNHIPLRCEEVERPKDIEARKKIEEAMSEKLMRFCPNCGKRFIKVDGCNKITCVCGQFLCYICGKIIYGYAHFSDHGGLCPLYTQNEELHVRDVVQAGIEARDQILQEDPNVRILYNPQV